MFTAVAEEVERRAQQRRDFKNIIIGVVMWGHV